MSRHPARGGSLFGKLLEKLGRNDRTPPDLQSHIPPRKGSETTAASQRSRMSVFVVDDDGDTRRFITRLLTAKTRHHVFSFADAEAVLDEFRRWSPTVRLTDLSLPGIQGEALAWAASRLVVPPRIILMSADANRLEEARALSDSLLRKPFSIAELLHFFEPPLEEK